MKSKQSRISSIIILIIFLTSTNANAKALPAKSVATVATEDLITIMDLSKPAFFTLQDTVWGPAPAKLPPGATLAVLEGDPAQAGPFTMRLKLPANYEIPAHWCSMDEHISVVSGHIFMGMGDSMDKNKGVAFPAGSFARIPLKMHHYIWTTEETVIQLHGIGPWIMGYVDPANDPTKPLDLISGETGSSGATTLEEGPTRDLDLVEELRKTGRLR